MKGNKNMSKMVAVKELSPGDVLADAVCSVVGKVLIAKCTDGLTRICVKLLLIA